MEGGGFCRKITRLTLLSSSSTSSGTETAGVALVLSFDFPFKYSNVAPKARVVRPETTGMAVRYEIA